MVWQGCTLLKLYECHSLQSRAGNPIRALCSHANRESMECKPYARSWPLAKYTEVVVTVLAPVRINRRASTSTWKLFTKDNWCALEHLVNPGAAQDAVCRGTFQNNPGGGLRSSVVLQTALEIASAMAFLHSHGIVHGVRLHSRVVPTVRRQRTPGAICAPTPCKTVHRASCMACARACRSRWFDSIYLAQDLFIRELTPCREGCPCHCLYHYSSLNSTPCVHCRT